MTQIIVPIVIFGFAVLLGLILFLCYKFVPAFRHKANTNTREENAKEEVDTIVRDDSNIIEEKKAILSARLKRIYSKIEVTNIDFSDSDYEFLVIQEKMNEIDKTFNKKF